MVLAAGCLLSALRSGSASEPPVAARIEALTLRTVEEGLVLEVRTSGPAHQYSCTAPTAARPELVIEWTEASSILPERTDLGDQRAPAAILEPRGEGARGVRL